MLSGPLNVNLTSGTSCVQLRLPPASAPPGCRPASCIRSMMNSTVLVSARVPGSLPSNASDESSFTSTDNRAGSGFKEAARTTPGGTKASIATIPSRMALLNEADSPDQVVGHDEVFIGVVLIRSRSLRSRLRLGPGGGFRVMCNHGELIAFPNPGGSLLRNGSIMSLVTNDHDRSRDELLPHGRRHGKPGEPVSVREIEVLAALDGRQAMLFDELLHFGPARFCGGFFLLTTVQLLVARGIRRLCLIGRQLLRRNRGGLMPRRGAFRLSRLLRLLLGAETRRDKLVAQGHAHDSIPLAAISDEVG